MSYTVSQEKGDGVPMSSGGTEVYGRTFSLHPCPSHNQSYVSVDGTVSSFTVTVFVLSSKERTLRRFIIVRSRLPLRETTTSESKQEGTREGKDLTTEVDQILPRCGTVKGPSLYL